MKNRSERDRGRRPQLLIGLLLALLVVLLPLPAGSNRPESLMLLLFAAGSIGIISAAVQLFLNQQPRRVDGVQTALLVLWLLWLGWISLQLVPVPEALLARLSPAAAAAYAHAAAWLDAPVIGSLSVARPDTLQLGLLSLAYFVLFIVAMRLQDRRARQLVIYAVILSAALQAAFGLAMVLSGLEIGPFGPKELYRGSATGTFVNRNHFAGFLEIGAALCLGLMIPHLRGTSLRSDRLRVLLRNLLDGLLSRNWGMRLLLLLMLIALIASRSRMGNVSFALSVALIVPLYLMLVPGPGRLRVIGLVALIALIDIGIVGSQLGLDELMQRFSGAALAGELRLSTFADIGLLIHEWGVTGAGLGSFAYIYPAVRSAEVYAFNDHAHNDYAQFLVEAGIPGLTLLALIALLVGIRGIQILRHRRNPDVAGIALGCLLAFVSLALHSLTDFNLQIPANAATLVILMGLLAGISPRPPNKRRAHTHSDGEAEASAVTDSR